MGWNLYFELDFEPRLHVFRVLSCEVQMPVDAPGTSHEAFFPLFDLNPDNIVSYWHMCFLLHMHTQHPWEDIVFR